MYCVFYRSASWDANRRPKQEFGKSQFHSPIHTLTTSSIAPDAATLGAQASHAAIPRAGTEKANPTSVSLYEAGCDAQAGMRERASASTALAPPLPALSFREVRIVVVDDEPANQRIAARFLKLLGVPVASVHVLSDGERPQLEVEDLGTSA